MHRSYSTTGLKTASLGMTLLLLSPLVGCDQSDPQILSTDKQRLVAWITDRPQTVRWEAILRAAAHKTPNYPFLEMLPTHNAGEVTDPSNLPSVAQQLAEATAAGAKYVILWHAGDPVPLEAITAAEQNGVTIVSIGRPIPRDRAANHVDIRLPAAAEQLGRELPNYAGPRRAFVLLHHRSRDSQANTRYERFRAGLAAQGEMVLVGHADATDRDPVAVLTGLLDQYPSTTLVVTLESDVWLRPAAPSIRSDVRYVTLDAPPALWSDLKRGRATAIIGPIDGEISAAALSLVADLATTAERPLPDRAVECRFVSRTNFADFAAAYAESVGLPLETLLP